MNYMRGVTVGRSCLVLRRKYSRPLVFAPEFVSFRLDDTEDKSEKCRDPLFHDPPRASSHPFPPCATHDY